jgi:hypothetical protein
MLVLMSIWLVGLAVAWKWEFAGALIVLVAFGCNMVINIRVLFFPGFSVPTTAILFLISWWLGKTRPQSQSSGVVP